jgi:hypothetical protein
MPRLEGDFLFCCTAMMLLGGVESSVIKDKLNINAARLNSE